MFLFVCFCFLSYSKVQWHLASLNTVAVLLSGLTNDGYHWNIVVGSVCALRYTQDVEAENQVHQINHSGNSSCWPANSWASGLDWEGGNASRKMRSRCNSWVINILMARKKERTPSYTQLMRSAPFGNPGWEHQLFPEWSIIDWPVLSNVREMGHNK